MLNAPIPLNESERLSALRRYCVLDTAPEPAFDRLTHILQHVLGVPTVLISIVDADRQWFKSRIGLDAEQTPRDISFCGHAVYLRETLIVPDARQDPRFSDNPLVTGELGLRFYAGTPLITSDGFALGTLCAIDYVPREAPTPAQLDIMSKLADAVVAALELRRFAQLQTDRAKLSTVLGQVAATANQALDLKSALATLLTELCDYTGAEVAHVYWRDPANADVFVSSGLWHVADDKTYAPLIDSTAPFGAMAIGELPGRVLVDAEPLLIQDLSAEAGVRASQAWALGLRSAMVFPIQAAGQIQCIVECYGQACVAPESDLLVLADYIGVQLGRLAERERVVYLKDDFVTTVSHELRTPLTSISGALELLDAGHAGELSPKASKMVRIALRNSLRLRRLVNDILDIGKIESGRIELELISQPLVALIEGAVAETEAFAQSLGVRLSFKAADGDAMAVVDADRFTQVMTNLLSNAAKFSPSGQVVGVTLVRSSAGLRISVSDRGPGIPDAFRHRIFEKFSQASGCDQKSSPSTGLGLSIVKKLVELMGGAVTFDSSPETGTVFHVDLPECPAAPKT